MKSRDDSGSSSSNKSWNDLFFGAVEKLAQASEKIRDSNQPLGAAFDTFKGLKDDLQAKVVKEFSDRLNTIDFESLAKKSAEHLAENYDVEVTAKVSLKPKKKAPKN